MIALTARYCGGPGSQITACPERSRGDRGFRWRLFLVLAAALALALAACAEDRAKDSDDDGLSDEQELSPGFGTDPNDDDSDDDGIPDGEDPMPLSKKNGCNLSMLLTTTPPAKTDGAWSCSLTLTLTDQDGIVVVPDELTAKTTLGELTDFAPAGDGAYVATLTSDKEGTAQVTITATTTTCGTHTYSDKVYFMEELPRPGINPFPFVNEGGIDGLLRVYTVDGESTVDPDEPVAPEEGVLVIVERTYPPALRLEKFSDATGIVQIKQQGLTGPVNITVAKAGHKAFTVMAVNAAHVSMPVNPLDPVPSVDQEATGAIEGVVTGFSGEFGITPFAPLEPSMDAMYVGIVQVGLKNVQLASLSMSSVLAYGSGPLPPNEIPKPPNMILPGTQFLEKDCRFQMGELTPGAYLVAVVAGVGKNVLKTIEDPYAMQFTPMAMGVNVVEVKPGKTVSVNLQLEIDFVKQKLDGVGVFDVSLGAFPLDPLNGEPFQNGLVLPVMDTGKYGFLWTDVNGGYNVNGSDELLSIVYPDPDHPALKKWGLDLYFMTVSLAGRKSFLGADPPGISTAIVREQASGQTIHNDNDFTWLRIPIGIDPAPPDPAPAFPCSPLDAMPDPPGSCVGVNSPPDDYFPLDRVGGQLTDGRIAWNPVVEPRPADLYAVRLGYLVSAPKYVQGYSIGGPDSHKLWEIVCPATVTSFTLPAIPADIYGKEGPLRNPAPNLGNPDDAQHFGPDTVEVEYNAYLMGEQYPFDYHNGFLFSDMNMNSGAVSQDSYPVTVSTN